MRCASGWTRSTTRRSRQLYVRLAAVRVAVDRAWLEAARAVEAARCTAVMESADAASWLARIAGERPGAARREVDLARVLGDAPAVADAAQAHALSMAQTAELAGPTIFPTM